MTMTDLSNKPISYTGSHPLELAYRALLARAEAAEALAYERLEDMLFAEQRATDADLRAEAAEAEVVDLHRQLAEMAAAMEEIEDERLALLARVAAQSAQGWRDFTERPPIGEPIQIITVIDAVREEPDGLYRIGNTSEWQAWRPAPQETTR
jgi:hypothetical protein